ncbi:hypothetical protein NDU88_003215 [Pleurodeles waltl]|uniref:Uncharacterized protein n=1 Tax=Pleurodeles waltl TaxID=8319 RepID=A0AAV7W692_PLEWA|nr:hypothetical protein NDU88_003215 [Pleurodeles waltl]
MVYCDQGANKKCLHARRPGLCAVSAPGARKSGCRESGRTASATLQSQPHPSACAVPSGAAPRSRGTEIKPYQLRRQLFLLLGRRDGPREREDRSSSLRHEHGNEARSRTPAMQAGGPRPPSLGSATPSCSLFSGVQSTFFKKVVQLLRCPPLEHAAPYTFNEHRCLDQDIWLGPGSELQVMRPSQSP